MLTFLAAVFFLLITPGPGVLTTAGVGSAYGFRAGMVFLTGLFVGTNMVAVVVATGLAALIFSAPWVQIAFFAGSSAYLLYLALKIAFAGAKIAFIHAERPPGFMGGVALQAINPKAYAVNTFLFSNFVVWPDGVVTEILIKFLLINLVWIPVHLVWLWAGVAVRRLNLAPVVQRGVNMAMAVSLMIVVALAIWAQIGGAAGP